MVENVLGFLDTQDLDNQFTSVEDKTAAREMIIAAMRGVLSAAENFPDATSQAAIDPVTRAGSAIRTFMHNRPPLDGESASARYQRLMPLAQEARTATREVSGLSEPSARMQAQLAASGLEAIEQAMTEAQQAVETEARNLLDQVLARLFPGTFRDESRPS